MSVAKVLPTVSVEGLTGCAGELLVILENLDHLLPYLRIKSFPFAQSRNENGPVDITFVEGSVSQNHDLEKLINIRANSRWLVAVGNCATTGCLQKASCQKCSAKSMMQAVYGNDSTMSVLPAQPLEHYVKVDVSLPGCPINATQFLAVTASLLREQLPYITSKPVCLECKMKENPCVLIEKNAPCLGPITAAGCGALCPSVGAACYGCWGVCDEPQIEAMKIILSEKGYDVDEIYSRLKAFGAPEHLFERMDKKAK